MSAALPKTQKQVHLLARPGREPISEKILGVVEAPVPDVSSNMQEGYVLVKTAFLSLDPSMRPSMDYNTKSYRPPAGLNEVFWAGGVGAVVKSSHPEFKEGDRVLSSALNAQQYALFDVNQIRRTGYFHKIDPENGIDEREYLSALWGTGLAAYLGMVEVAKVKKGDRVLVSGAAGSTGTLAIQIAKARGAAEVIGVAGGAEKSKYVVEEVGADSCIDYREKDYTKKIAALSDRPEGGIDVYFDNVGGETLDAALLAMNASGRIACCGAISAYSGAGQGLKYTTSIVSKRLSLQGYIAFPTFWPSETWQGAVKQLGAWAAQGTLKSKFHFYEQVGVEHFKDALNALFAGKNWGKMLLQVDPEWKPKGARL
ncbi:unnamed protein product [Sympodiomycopsis kandeliae]